MSYTEDYLKAKEKGKTDQAVVEILTWDTEGQEVIGKLIGIGPFTEGKFDMEVKKYTIETDHGKVSTVLGAATDKQLASKVKIGTSLYIKWKGQKEIGGGRHVNLFEVETF